MPILYLDSSCQTVLRFAGRPEGIWDISSGVRWWQRGWRKEYNLTGDLAYLGLTSVGWHIRSFFPSPSLLFRNMEAELRTASPSISQGPRSLGIVVPGLRKGRKEGGKLWGMLGNVVQRTATAVSGHEVWGAEIINTQGRWGQEWPNSLHMWSLKLQKLLSAIGFTPLYVSGRARLLRVGRAAGCAGRARAEAGHAGSCGLYTLRLWDVSRCCAASSPPFL